MNHKVWKRRSHTIYKPSLATFHISHALTVYEDAVKLSRPQLHGGKLAPHAVGLWCLKAETFQVFQEQLVEPFVVKAGTQPKV